MIIEKRGSFLEASDEEKSERVLVLTCGIDGIGRSPDFYNFIKKYPLDKKDYDILKNINIENEKLGLVSNSYAAEMKNTDHPFKSLFLLASKKKGLSVPEPYMHDALYHLLSQCKMHGYKKFIMPLSNLSEDKIQIIRTSISKLYSLENKITKYLNNQKPKKLPTRKLSIFN